MRRTLTITALSLIALTAGACGTSSASSSSGASKNGSTLACGHWANIRGDVSAGILTISELRSKVSEVRDSATSPAVESAATKLLSGITSSDKSDIAAGAKALNSACS
jgi:hypothetical protein